VAMDFIFFVRVTLIKIVNTPLDRSAALVFIRNYLNLLQLHWYAPHPAKQARISENGRTAVADLPKPGLKSGATVPIIQLRGRVGVASRRRRRCEHNSELGL